ncbi:phosphoenolpyruvate-protein phosphotransferase [Alicyclobacillus contaminans]|uniref:phosphoenolpyruvate--protein phosphotransferase n=1 Tax=Alicyclobacillus contaminans TaxID=392016 RepID=UPI00041CEA69|nr:phosphoenolpyruvate--protein phosphotransferase [Alicyclobacillus contaminans]GMA50057.1 phosphoenolpyruvate-protein phosphotransferase [Alicyclobacillus contaminans]
MTIQHTGQHTLTGIGVSPGLAVGRPVWLRQSAAPAVERRTLQANEVASEVERFRAAVAEAKAQISRIRARVAKEIGEHEAQVFDAHLTFLEDPAYVGEIERKIEADAINAEAACADVTTATREMLQALPDEYLQARADDIRDVGQRLLRCLLGETAAAVAEDETTSVIWVADELMPSDLSALPKNVTGLASVGGSKTAHTAIMARTLGIPAVYGIGDALRDELADSDVVILNGDEGTLQVHPSPEEIAAAEKTVHERSVALERAREIAQRPAVTKDGVRIDVFANVGGPQDFAAALANGADGIGLFRTEFLYLENDHWPTEQEQYEVYRQALEAFGERPVIIRTLDIGGDKSLPYATLPTEENPFLGLRAIRYCLAETEVFRTQLRALLRASAHGTLWIMFPMVETLDELQAAKAWLERCRAELIQEGVAVAERIPVGIMVETPAAAMTADILAQESDFFSIGTNDLTQYTLAADRGNPSVSGLYNPAHPAVLRLIANTCSAAAKAGIPVGMCGEFAGDPVFTELLVGLGLQELSMSASFIPAVKEKVNATEGERARKLAEQALQLGRPEAVEALVKSPR